MIGSTSLAAGGSGGNVQVWVATSSVDMRKSFDGLAEVVRAFLGHDPLGGSLFVFRNRSAERVKILWWDRDGLAIYYKRLEKGTFQFPAGEGKSIAISSSQLVKLLSGCAIEIRQ
jgi:transposase